LAQAVSAALQQQTKGRLLTEEPLEREELEELLEEEEKEFEEEEESHRQKSETCSPVVDAQ